MLADPPAPDPAVVDGVPPDVDVEDDADVVVVAAELAGEVDAAFVLAPQPATVTMATTATPIAQRRAEIPDRTVTVPPGVSDLGTALLDVCH
jgi:hypothetical protein